MSAFRSGFAAIIGRPNVGKSTLMNHLIGQKVAITSDRPQTTRDRIMTVLTREDGQVVFLDTPGFIRKSKNRLGEYMQGVSIGTLADADVILWLVEPSAHAGAGDQDILGVLGKVKTPVFLVINKVDLVPKTALMGIIDSWKDRYPFAEIIPVSGLKQINLDELANELIRYMPEGPMLYDEETLTDQPMRQIVSEIIREKALRSLREEIPHGIAVVIDEYRDEDPELIRISASVIAEKESHKGIIIGRGGEMLRRIGTSARREIEEMTGRRVFLKLFVKVRKDWRDSEMYLREYGYTQK